MSDKPTYEELVRQIEKLEEDVLYHQKTEENVTQSYEFLNNILNTLDAPVFVKDENRRWVLLNDKACEVLNRPREALIGKIEEEVFPEKDARECIRSDKQVLKDGKACILEEIISCQGKPCSFSIRKSLFTDESTGKKFIVGVIQDVSIHRASESLLRRYEFIVNTSREFMTLIDSNFVYEAVNESYCKAHGKKRSEIVGYTVEEVWGSDAFSHIIQNCLVQCFEGKEVSYESWFKFTGQEPRYYDVRYYPYVDARNIVSHAVVVSHDITKIRLAEETLQRAHDELEKRVEERTRELKKANELLRAEIRQRKQIEAALSASEKKYRLLAENAEDVIWTIDTDANFTYVSPSVERLLGIPSDQVLKKKFYDISADAYHDNARKIFANPLPADEYHQDEYRRFELELLRNDNSTVWGEISASPIRNTDGQVTGFTGVTREITERKIFETRLRKAKEIAEKANQAKGIFLANMSHEIRTPINAILSMAGLLLNTPLNPDQRDYSETIYSSSEILLSLINDILDFSKIESGKIELEHIAFNLREIIRKTIDMLAIKAHEKGLSLSWHVHKDIPPAFRGDPGRLCQILMNLISNAIKFTRKGNVTVQVDVETDTPDRITLLFQISDTGIGIPEDRRDRLFKPFSQVDVSTTRQYGGTGLGLAISKQFSEMMGGRIGVESEPGKGSVFWFTAVFEKLSEKYDPETVENFFPDNFSQYAGAIPEDLKDKIRILVVEDNVPNQKVAQAILKKFGFHADVAGNGKEAVEIIGHVPYDLVLMDVHMPEMDGVEATKKIRDSASDEIRNLPIIAMTADAVKGESERYIAAGMNDYISKPVKPRALLAAIEHQLWGNVIHTDITTKDGDTKNQDSVENLSAVTRFDKDELLYRVDGDQTIFHEILTIFLETVPNQMMEIRAAVNQNNSDMIAFYGHSIKGMAANITAYHFSKIAAEMELAGRNKELEKAKSFLIQLEEAFEDFRKELLGEE